MKTKKKILSINKQINLLNNCIQNGLDLSEELKIIGHSYDSLRYRNNEKVVESKANYINIDDIHIVKENGIPTISFFAGCGGLDIGFERAGFKHLLSIEINEIFCNTLRKNRPDWKIAGPPYFSGDLRNIDENIELIKDTIGINGKSKFEGIFHGGPPCQPFSIAANQRFSKWGDNFKRVGFNHEAYGNLLFDFITYISIFKPRVFLIENVPGLKTVDNGEQIRKAISILENEGYKILDPTVIDSARYGIPQFRKRLILIGWRGKGSFEFPIGNNTPTPCYKALEKHFNGAKNNETRKHKAESIFRYMELEYGKRDHLGRVDRLNPNLPSKTVIAGGTKGGGRSHLHPFIPRTLSVRESARLQTFPDSYNFDGPTARQFNQVGNAVPPVLAYKLANSIYEGIFQK